MGGSGGGAPFVKHFITLGAQPPLKFLHWPCFSKLIDQSIFYCFKCIATWLLRHFYLLIILYQYEISLSHLSSKNIGVAAARPHPTFGCT